MVFAPTWATTWAVLPTKRHLCHQLVMIMQRQRPAQLAVHRVIHATGTKLGKFPYLLPKAEAHAAVCSLIPPFQLLQCPILQSKHLSREHHAIHMRRQQVRSHYRSDTCQNGSVHSSPSQRDISGNFNAPTSDPSKCARPRRTFNCRVRRNMRCGRIGTVWCDRVLLLEEEAG